MRTPGKMRIPSRPSSSRRWLPAAVIAAAMAVLPVAVPVWAAADPATPATVDTVPAPPNPPPAGIPRIGVRSGSHPGFGRVVIDLPHGADAVLLRDGGHLVVRFVGGTAVPAGAPPPRNVLTLAVTAAGAEALLAPAVGVRQTRLADPAGGDRLIIDLLDPPSPSGAGAAPSIASVAPATPGSAASARRPEERRRFSIAGQMARHGRDGPPAEAPAPATPAKPAATGDDGGGRDPLPPAPPAIQAGPAAPASGLTPPAAATPPVPAPPAPAAVIQADATPSPPSPSDPAPADPPAPAADAATAATAAGTDAAPPAPAAPAAAAAGAAGAEPIGLAARVVSAADGAPALLLPVGPRVCAAAFPRGGDAVVVLDARRPIDLAGVAADPVFGRARVRLLPEATELRLPLPPGADARLSRADGGWLVAIASPPAAARGAAWQPIRPEVEGPRLRLPAQAPGTVVSVPDGDTGRALLVGTQTAPGQGLVVARRLPAFALLPTWLGVAVEPSSDAVVLRVAAPPPDAAAPAAAPAGPDAGPGAAAPKVPPAPAAPRGASAAVAGFVLESGVDQRTLDLGPAEAAGDLLADASHLTRRFDLPALPIAALERRLQASVAAAADAAPRARGIPRRDAAQAMVALGMGAEARALLTLAAAEDADLATDPDTLGLTAIAAVLAGRPDEAAGLDDPRLSGSDEIALWRAVRRAMRAEGDPAAAATFAATLPLIRAYPAPLRDRLLPLAAETMALGGEPAAARTLVDAEPADPSLDMARALLATHADGGAPAALAILDRLAGGSDRLLRARAAVAAIELRLATGALTPARAADALDQLIYAWRGDRRELALRERVAELRAATGAWRPALAMLLETETLWPDPLDDVRRRMRETFDAALEADARAPLPPLDLVMLVEENADLAPSGEAAETAAARLADRLMMLDLPRRAAPVLEKLMTSAPAGPSRAVFGGRLADLRLQQGDPAAALVALSASTAPVLPPALTEERTRLYARARAASGHLPEAVAALAALDTAAGDELAASLLEQARAWPDATRALVRLAGRLVPADAPLNDGQARLLVRLASAAAQADDQPVLTLLRTKYAPLLPDGPLGQMLRTLTQGPVDGVSDLPRAAQETKIAGGLPAEEAALAPPRAAPPARSVAAR